MADIMRKEGGALRGDMCRQDAGGLRRSSRLLRAAVLLSVALRGSVAMGSGAVYRRERQLRPSLHAKFLPASHPQSGSSKKIDDPNDIRSQCPYAIFDKDEAVARALDTSAPGNIVTVTSARYGRMGNHFIIVLKNLAVGYCCKSRLLMLPWKDDTMAPGMFSDGDRGTNWYEFSEAPDVEGFNSSSCTVDISWGGTEAFHATSLLDPQSTFYNPELRHCAGKAPRLLACEALYYFPTSQKELCSDTALTSGGAWNDTPDRGDRLVLHVRSGVIFTKDDPHPGYGQPPLQYYVLVMRARAWRRIDVVTYAAREKEMNPVIPALQTMVDQGVFNESEVHIYTNRSMDEDLRAMLCADALGTAVSTIGFLTVAHTTAPVVFFPRTCEKMEKSTPRVQPGQQVFGLYGMEEYSPMKRWWNTPEQRTEMVTYENVSLRLCDPW